MSPGASRTPRRSWSRRSAGSRIRDPESSSRIGIRITRLELSRSRIREPADRRLQDRRGVRLAPRRHSRLRCNHRCAGLELPHRSPPRRVRLRRMAEGRLQRSGRYQRLGRHEPGRGARHHLRADRFTNLRLLWRRSHREQPVRQLSARAGCENGQAALALSGRPSRPLGLRQHRTAAADHGAPQRQESGRRRDGRQDGSSCTSSTA